MILYKNQFAFWICAAMTTVNAAVSTAFSIAAVLSASSANAYAMYGASRSVACLVTAILAMCLRSRVGVAAIAFTMVVVQAGDGIIGIVTHDPLKTFGPFFLAGVTGAALVSLLRQGSILRSSA